MSLKRGTPGGGPASPSMTVAEYSRQFFDRVLRKSYGPTEEENVVVAGQKFCTLVKKLQDAASKDDVKVTLRVLRDEIGRVYFASSQEKRQQKIDTLFRLYDALEAECQENAKMRGKEAQQAATLLAELRDRFMRLAVGETWENFPELRLLALKRIQKYAVKENENLKLRGKLGMMDSPMATGNKAMGKRFTQAMTGGSGPVDTWQGVLNNLNKASSTKLLPLLKALLLESHQRGAPTAETAGDGEGAAPTGDAAASSEPPSPAASTPARDLSSVPSSTSTGESAGHKLSELKLDINLDDLLGLNDPVPAPAAAAPANDPFQFLAENGARTPATPVPAAPARSPDFGSPFAQFGAPSPNHAAGFPPGPGAGIQRGISNASSSGLPPPANPFGETAAFPAFHVPSPSASEPPGFAAAAAGGFSGGLGAPGPATPSTPAPAPAAAPYSFPPVPMPAAGAGLATQRPSAGGFEGTAFSGGFADLVNTPFSQGPTVSVASPAGAAPAGFAESAFSPGFGVQDPSPAAGTPAASSANPFHAPPAGSAPGASRPQSFSAW